MHSEPIVGRSNQNQLLWTQHAHTMKCIPCHQWSPTPDRRWMATSCARLCGETTAAKLSHRTSFNWWRSWPNVRASFVKVQLVFFLKVCTTSVFLIYFVCRPGVAKGQDWDLSGAILFHNQRAGKTIGLVPDMVVLGVDHEFAGYITLVAGRLAEETGLLYQGSLLKLMFFGVCPKPTKNRPTPADSKGERVREERLQMPTAITTTTMQRLWTIQKGAAAALIAAAAAAAVGNKMCRKMFFFKGPPPKPPPPPPPPPTTTTTTTITTTATTPAAAAATTISVSKGL